MVQVSFQRAYPPARPRPGVALWFLYRGEKMLVQVQETGYKLISGVEADFAPLKLDSPLYLGTLNDLPCMAGEVEPEHPLPADWRELDLRRLFGSLDEPAYLVAGYAAQLLRWQRVNRYCAVCGQPVGELSVEWAHRCSHCGHVVYPPVTPAVLVLVHKGTEVLLAHKPGWGARYSIIAGFVEPGETLEDCVRREVAEEVGIEISDVTYAGSQPWPFPHQLMVGFTASYAGGEVQPDQKEIDKAGWFRFDQLPELPPQLSLSRQLIMSWVNTQ